MSLLNPAMLIGLAALVVPFIILLLFRKKVVLNWAVYEWMAKATQKKHKQNLLDNLLKLLAKLLLLLILVFLMSRPALKTDSAKQQLLVIDVTPSMATVLDNGTRLSRAIELAREVIENAQGDIAIAAYDGSLIPLASLSGSPDPQVLESAALTGNSGDFEQFVNSLLASGNLSQTPQILFFTDAQRKDFEDPQALERILEPLTPNQIVIIPVNTREESQNVGLTGFFPPEEGYLPGKTNRMGVMVKNFSNQPMDVVPITAEANGVLLDRTTINLPPNSEQRVDLYVGTPPGETHLISFGLPKDLYPLDDTWHVAATPSKRLRVLSISPSHGEDPFEYDVFFESALRAYVPEEALHVQRNRPHQLLSLRLHPFDVIVTFGVPLRTDAAISNLLMEYVEDGGALLAFADGKTTGDFEAFGGPPTTLVEEPRVPDPERLSSGILDFMTEPGLDASKIRLLKFFTLDLEESRSLMHLENEDHPLAVHLPYGKGQAVLAGFLPYPGYTDMIYNPNVVQIVMRLLQQALPANVIQSIEGKGIASIQLPEVDAERRYTLNIPDEPARLLEVMNADTPSPLLSGEPHAGNYFPVIQRDEEDLTTIGYNINRSDSDIRASSVAELEPFLSDRLSVQAGSESETASLQVEYASAMALLLLLVMSFDVYAHLWRKA